MRKPLIYENWDDKNDIISRYNPGKYQNHEGNYWIYNSKTLYEDAFFRWSKFFKNKAINWQEITDKNAASLKC